jgi:VWFA-related protein
MFAGKTGASRAASTLLALSIPLLVCVHALLPLTLAGNQAQENPPPPYAIGLLDEHSADQNPKVLQKLATYTGGEAYFPNSFVEVMNVCRETAADIRHQYTLGYTPTDTTRPGYHKIHVSVSAPGHGKLYVRTRAGYFFQPKTPMQTQSSASGKNPCLA